MQAIKEEMSLFMGGFRRALDHCLQYEADAIRMHIDALYERVAIARQAGDMRTLVRDQFEMLENSRTRLRAHGRGLVAIVQQWRRSGRTGGV